VPAGSRGTTSGGGAEPLTIIGPAIGSPKRLKKSETCSLRLGQSGLRTQTANQAKLIYP